MARKMYLFIEGRRDGYTPAQCYSTMTVRELIEALENYSDDTLVYLNNDNGYTYGSIDYSSFEEAYSDDFDDNDDE